MVWFGPSGPPCAGPPCAGPPSAGCCVKPQRLWGRRGFTRQPKNSKRAHLSAPALQTPKFYEKTPQRGKKRTNFAVGEGKKKREFLGPHPSRPHLFFNPTKTLTNPVTKSFALTGPGLHAQAHPPVPVEGVSSPELCAQRRPKSDVVTTFAAHDNIAPQRICHACSARFCKIPVSWHALALANCDTNDLVSDQRPPTSITSTTSLARERGPTNSGCVCVFRGTCTLPHSPTHISSVPEPKRAHDVRTKFLSGNLRV